MKTRAEVEAMSREERRIATAELCGWKEIKPEGFRYGGFPSMEDVRLVEGPCGRWRTTASFYTLPDYLDSLDAMHEAEKVLLTGNGWRERLERYSRELMEEMHDSDFGRIDVAFKDDKVGLRYFTIHATALQRNTVFLRMMLP